MTNDIDARAQRLLEKEDLAAQERAEAEREEAEGSRLADARRRIKAHDAEREAETARKEATAEVEDLVYGLHDDDTEAQDLAERLLSVLRRREGTRDEVLDAMRRAGLVDGVEQMRRATKDRQVRESWFKGTFGGPGSLVGVPSENEGRIAASRQEYRTLAERDPLASPVKGRAGGES